MAYDPNPKHEGPFYLKEDGSVGKRAMANFATGGIVPGPLASLLKPPAYTAAVFANRKIVGKRDEWAARMCRYVVMIMAPGSKVKEVAPMFPAGSKKYTIEGVGAGTSATEMAAWFEAALYCYSQNPDRYLKLLEVAQIHEVMMAPQEFAGMAEVLEAPEEDDDESDGGRDAVGDTGDLGDAGVTGLIQRWKDRRREKRRAGIS